VCAWVVILMGFAACGWTCAFLGSPCFRCILGGGRLTFWEISVGVGVVCFPRGDGGFDF